MFKLGSKVVCIDACSSADIPHGTFTLNKIYTVDAISGNMLRVEGVNKLVNKCRFKLVEEEEMFDHKSTHNFKVGDRVKCTNTGGTACLKLGNIYTINKVLVGGALILDLNNSQYNHSLFEIVKSEADLMVVGAVVECIDAQGFLPNEGLVKGQRYKVLKDFGSKISLDGICKYVLVKTRFKLVPSNNLKNYSRESLYKKLEEFRGIGEFNQIIVSEGIYYCESEHTWKSDKEDSIRWVFFIKGAWTMFNVGS